MTNKPIFIVGAPRSGTTLLSAILGSHSRIACGPETQFFSKLNLPALRSAAEDSYWPKKGVKLLRSLTLSGEKVHKLFELEIETINGYLYQRQPSIQALLEAFTDLHARKMGKPRWAEKTPNHLLYLSEIKEFFPDAAIIRIIRDPRDSAMSMRKLPWASKSILANCYLWDEWFRRSNQFFIDNSNTLTIRYEDLVRKPQDVLRLVCKHINEDFEEAMLNTAASAQSVAPPNEPWKSQVGQPLDSSRTYVWKRQLPQELWFATSHICQLGIEEFDYELTSKPKQTFFAYDVNRAFVEKNENFIISLANNQIYIAPARNKQSTTNDELMNPNLVICKLPDMGATNTQRLINTYRFVMMLIRRRINGNINKYLECCTDSDVVRGIAQKACISSLRLLGTKTEFSLEELSN